MLENLVLIAVVIMILWLATLAYYLFTSDRQADLQESIESLRNELDKANNQNN